MIKLTIVETDEYANYILEDITGKKYDVNINFMDMDKPKVGTIIYIPKSVIDENVSLNYGKILDKDLKDENELLLLVTDNKKIYLERFYG